MSYAELDSQSARWATLLSSYGLVPGDRVVAQIEKSAQAVFLYLGCLRAGLVYLPLNTAYRDAEVEYFIEDARPALAVCDPRARSRFGAVDRVLELDAEGKGQAAQAASHRPAQAPVVARAEDDAAALLYTSGTTGRPKGAVITHGNLASNALALYEAWRFGPEDVLLHTLPLFHVHGLFVALHTAFLASARIVLLARFDAAEVVERLPQATVYMGVPTHYVRLLAQPGLDRERCRAMRLFVSGSAPLAADTLRRFEERTGHRILERYGMTETGMNTSNPCEGERRPGSVGLPLRGVSVRVADAHDRALPAGQIGEIQVKGPNVFPGYWHRPERQAEDFTDDGYFRTGDLGRFDGDGYLTIVGRSKEVIISGGYNIYPKEVERLLDAMPDVEESSVVGVPDPEWGEAVAAAVVPRPGCQLSEEAVIAWARKRIAGFKVPKRVAILRELPRNAMGKVQKDALRALFLAEKASPQTRQHA